MSEYDQLEAAFLPVARKKLQAIRDGLLTQYGTRTTEIDVIDHDDERGLGFAMEGDDTSAVEFILADGESRKFEGVNVTLAIEGFGYIYAPNNFTDEIGTKSAEEVVRRTEGLDVQSCVDKIWNRWTEVRLRHLHLPRNY